MIDDLEVKSTLIYSCVFVFFVETFSRFVNFWLGRFVYQFSCLFIQSSLEAAAPFYAAAGLASTVTIE